MSIDWSALVTAAESDLSRTLTAKVVAGIIASIPWLSFLGGPLGFFIGLIIGQLVKYGDWAVYMIGDSLKNSAEGSAYEDKALALNHLPPTATKEEIDAAKQAKIDAFNALMGAS